MLRQQNLHAHLPGAPHHFVEVLDFKPEENAVAVGPVSPVADRPMVMGHAEAVQLKDELPAVHQLLVRRSAVIAAASEQPLIPPAAGFDIGDCDERLGTHSSGHHSVFWMPASHREVLPVKFNRSVPVDSVLPHVTYRDVDEAVAWLTRVFGFAEHYRYGDPVSGAQIRTGDAFFMVDRAKPEEKLPAQLGYGTQSLTIFVDEVEAHYERAKSAGAEIVEEPHETEYGEFQYAALDLAGHHWLFSRHARDRGPAEWGAMVVRPTGAPARIAPTLSVRRGKAAVDFYTAAFDAQVLLCIEAPDGDVVAELAVGQSRFWVADESPEHKNFSPETLGGGTVRMALVVDDPDGAYQRAIAAGATAVNPVADQSYGWRVGRLVDPFGHHWEIGKPL